MMKTALGLTILAALIVTTVPSGSSAAPPSKAAYQQRTLKDHLRGVWKGNGDVKEGLMQGRGMQLHLTFAKGDFSDTTVIIESKESRIQFITANPKTRAIYFRLFYDPSGSFEMPILCTGTFDVSYTTISGTFKASFGSGPFSITKEVPCPDPEHMQGTWTCVVCPQPATRTRKLFTFEIVLPTGTFDETCTVSYTSDDTVRVHALKPFLHDEAERSIDLCLTCRMKKRQPDAVYLQGTFNEDYTELAGRYVSRSARLGKGSFRMMKKPAAPPPATAAPTADPGESAPPGRRAG